MLLGAEVVQMQMSRRRDVLAFSVVVSVLCLLLVAAAPARAATDQTLVSCPFSGGNAGYNLTRGIFVTGYQGTNLDQVALAYIPGSPGSYTITLIARSGTYDGPIIGTAATDVTLTNTAGSTPVTFSFGAKPVPQGSTVAFTQSYTGAGILQLDPGTTVCPNVTLTNGTTPPLDTTLSHIAGLTIAQALPNQPSGQRAAALKKCKKKHSTRARRKCRKRAQLLPA